jgi:archaeal flagellar protein FlaJ
MTMEFKPTYFISIILGLGVITIDVILFLNARWFLPIIILGLSLFWIQFGMDLFKENKKQKEKEIQFLEFIRNLTESVKSGISIPKSILHVSKKDFTVLNPFIKKLANQIESGIPTRKAMLTFAADTNNAIIKRSISIIIEAEQSGGDISDILTSVVNSVVNVKKIKEERKAGAYSQIVQGYIVFFVFIAIMLIMQLWLFPKLVGLSSNLQGGLGSSSGETFNLDRTFFSLIMIQGFFAGIMIGKFSEGSIKNGLIHSMILMIVAALLVTVIKGSI